MGTEDSPASRSLGTCLAYLAAYRASCRTYLASPACPAYLGAGTEKASCRIRNQQSLAHTCSKAALGLVAAAGGLVEALVLLGQSSQEFQVHPLARTGFAEDRSQAKKGCSTGIRRRHVEACGPAPVLPGKGRYNQALKSYQEGSHHGCEAVRRLRACIRSTEEGRRAVAACHHGGCRGSHRRKPRC